MTDNATDNNDTAKSDVESDRGPTDATSGPPPELAHLLAKISNRIAEASDVEGEEADPKPAPMEAMRERLDGLRDRTSAARENIKIEGQDTFANVEAALAKLSEQVDADAREQATPDAPDSGDEAWNDDAAEALTSHCEAAGLADEPQKKDLLIGGNESQPEVAAEPVNYVYLQPDAKEIGQQWFEDRFEELAGRLDTAISGKPEDAGASYAILMEKMDALEIRLTDLLGTPAGGSEEGQGGALQDIELCIAEIATQLEATSVELKRLETLEDQIAQLSDTLTKKPSGPTGNEMQGEGAFDPMAIADLVAQKISQNASVAAVSAVTSPEGSAENVNDLSAAVKDFIRERRSEGEHANAVLDTMQKTIMRLLDRMEMLEKSGSARVPIEAPQPAAKSAAVGAEARPREMAVFAASTNLDVDQDEMAPPVLEVPARDPAEPMPAGSQGFGRKKKRGDEVPASAPSLLTDPLVSDDDAGSLDRLQQVVGELEDSEANAAASQSTANPVARNRADFIASARRAAAKAGGQESGRSGTDAVLAERAKLTAQARRIGNSEVSELNDDDDTDEIDATRDGFSLGSLGARFRPKKKKSNGGARLLVVTLTLVAVGLGASKFIMSQSSDAARQELQSQQRQYQGTRQVGAVAPLSGAPRQLGPTEPAPQLSGRLPNPVANGLQGTSPQAATKAPAAGTVSINQNGRFGSLVQPAAINPQGSQAADSKSVSGGRGQVNRQELPSMLVGPLSLRLAAASGDPSAEFQVGARFADGRGVQQDLNEAIKWYGRSASRGFALAQYRLGTLHERGLGVPKDVNRARVWYQRAAGNDNIKAMHNLAVLAASPTGGKPDYVTAADWFNKAAERGLADSQFNLAILYQNGLGVARNEAKAYKWFSLAATSGDGESVKRMTELAAKLGKKRVQQLDEQTQGWTRKPASKMSNDPHHAGQAWQRKSSGA